MIFYIDTSSSFLFTAVVDKNKVLKEIKQQFEKDLSTNTLYLISDMFKNLDINPKDIQKIIVVNGPGSFTGIRIGVTIAKTFAWTLKIPIITISSLEAMSLTTNNFDYNLPTIDARRNCSYVGVYDKNGNCVLKDQYMANEKIIEYVSHLKGDYTFISNDSDISKTNTVEYNPNILKIVNKYKDRETINPHNVEPNYLKLTEAEENLK